MSDREFLDALEAAQKMPDFADELGSAVPDILSDYIGTQLVSKVSVGESKIAGSKEYAFDYHCARFVIGKEEAGLSPMGRPEYTDRDDSDQLKEIMNLHLDAKAIVSSKKETFLKDGTVVIWVEWLLPKTKPKEMPEGALPLEDLLSPEPGLTGPGDT